MVLAESLIKKLIKEEIMNGLAQKSLYQRVGDSEEYAHYPDITDDEDILTVGELKKFLEAGDEMGDKMCRAYLTDLDLIVNYATSTSRKYQDEHYTITQDFRRVTGEMTTKICGINYEDIQNGDRTRSKLFWERFRAAAGDPNDELGYAYKPSEEAQQEFGLTDDETYAYEMFTM